MTEIDILDRDIRWNDDLCVAAWVTDAAKEIKHLRYCHGDVSRMLTDAARFIDEQNKEINKLKSDLNLYMDLCDKKEEWLQYYKKRAEDAERNSND